MITKEYLDEYEKNMKNYDYEIEKLKRDIQEERCNRTADSVKGSSKIFPYIEGHKVIEGINESRIKKLEKRKKNYKKKKEKAEKELKYKIDNLDDRIVADIIEKKYLKGMDFNKISMKRDYADESGARKVLKRYLEKN